MKLHLDEDADAHALLNALRQRGLDVSSSRELALLRCSDEEQLAWASEQGRTIYTYNASDFCRLHSEFLEHGRHPMPLKRIQPGLLTQIPPRSNIGCGL